MPLQDDLLDQVRATIERHQLLEPGQTVLVGVSGGPDSVSLLHLLHQMAAVLNLSVHVAHVDHQLRGQESAADAAFVAELARARGVFLHSKAVDTSSFAAGKGMAIEEAARHLRFEWFTKVAVDVGAARVALAHTLDDQAETVLYRLVRGAAGPGMLGIPRRRRIAPAHPQIQVVRPLLDIRREQILEYCRKQGVAYRMDSSNLEESLPRNFLRHRVIPLLMHLNPHWHDTLHRNLAILAEEHAYLEEQARHLWQDVQRNSGAETLWELDRKRFVRWPPAIQRRGLYRILREFTAEQVPLNAHHLEALRELFCKARGGGEVHLPQGFLARREGLTIRLLREQVTEVPPFEYSWQDHGARDIPELQCRTVVSALADPPADLHHPPADTAYFAGECLHAPLVWRNWRAGDRFAPMGMQGHRKLARWLVDQYIPRRERSRLLLLASGSEVLWIAGRRRSRLAPVLDSKQVILRVRVEPLLAAR